MSRFAWTIAILTLGCALANAEPLLPGMVQEFAMLPVTLADGRQVRLETMVLRPDRPGRMPLVVLVHGNRYATEATMGAIYAAQAPADMRLPAVAFATHGYAVVSIMRQGFGQSDGPFREFATDTCATRDYRKQARLAAEDVTAAVNALREQPWVDPQKVTLLGHSTGGVAVIAAAASNPPGVVAVLNITGVNGGDADNHICNPDGLAGDFASFGQTARIPSLWLYVENDLLVGPRLGRSLFEAYSAAGAPAEWQLLPPIGGDGHDILFTSPQSWWPAVEGFLAQHDLPTETVVSLPPLAALPPPVPLNEACGTLFARYLAARTSNKAFAWNPEGHCAFNMGARPTVDAGGEALKMCRAYYSDCVLYAVGQRLQGG